jgi:hypothetical protein
MKAQNCKLLGHEPRHFLGSVEAAEFSDRRVAEVEASCGANAAEARLRAAAAGKLTRNTVADLLRD